MKFRSFCFFCGAATSCLFTLVQAAPVPEAFWSDSISPPISKDLANLKTGFNVNTIYVEPWNDPETLKMFADLSAQLLRFPGGNDASFWDWRKGWFVDRMPDAAPAGPENAQRRGPQGRAKPLESLVDAVRGTGAAPILILNLYTSDIDDQLAMLRHARELGIQLPYVELGNECYWGRFRDRFPSGYAYARDAVTWTERIKREFPATKVGLVVQAIEEDQDFIPLAQNAAAWSKGVTRAWKEHPASFPDAVIIHPYTNPGGPRYKELLRKGKLDDDGLRAVFASAFLSGEKVKATMAGLPATLTPWITEYSMMDLGIGNDGHTLVQTEWAHALYTAIEGMNLLMVPRIEVLIYHDLGGAPNFSTNYQAVYSGAYKVRYGRTPGEPNALTGPGLVWKKLGAAKKGMDRAQVVVLPNVARVPANIGAAVSYPGAMGITFEKGGECRTILINLTDRPFTAPLTALTAGSAAAFHDRTIESFSASPLLPVIDLATDVKSTIHGLEASVELPAYSFNYVH